MCKQDGDQKRHAHKQQAPKWRKGGEWESKVLRGRESRVVSTVIKRDPPSACRVREAHLMCVVGLLA
jgi:hypothetical protein